MARHITCRHNFARAIPAMLHHAHIPLCSFVKVIKDAVMLQHALAVGGDSYAVAYHLEGGGGFDNLGDQVSICR